MMLAFRTACLVAAVLAGLAVGAVVLVGPRAPSGGEPPGPAVEGAGADARALLPVVAIAGLDPQRVALGRRLFHDPQLSRDGSVSCATCHNLATGGADHRRRSTGVDGAVGVINAPTVYNAALNFRQFWDGRAATLEEQAAGPITDPREMGSSWAAVVAAVAADPAYATAFARLYAEGVAPRTISDALATFERSLTTPGCRFDRYLGGEAGAITAREAAGYRLFTTLGCSSCHQGAGIGGNMFQRFGLMEDYFGNRGGEDAADLGRFAATHRERDRHAFKVPSLRNVALTAPYFHDGSAATLEEAVVTMARYELGTHLEGDQVALLVAFLGTLTGPGLASP